MPVDILFIREVPVSWKFDFFIHISTKSVRCLSTLLRAPLPILKIKKLCYTVVPQEVFP